MIKQILFSIVIALMIKAFRIFSQKINKSRVDPNNPKIQLLPTGVLIGSWVLFAVTIFVILLFFLFLFVKINKNDPNYDMPIGFLAFISLAFIGPNIWFRFKYSGHSYQELDNHFILKNRNKTIKMVYSEIDDWRTNKRILMVLDKDQIAEINLMWFKPVKLLNHLIDKQKLGHFIYQSPKK